MRKKLPLVFAIAFTLILSSCYVAKRSDEFFGVKTSDKHTLYLIDISGSMEGIDEGSIKDQVAREAGNQAGKQVQKAIGGKVGSILGKQVTKQATKLGAVKRKLIPAIKGLPDGKQFAVFAFNDNVVKNSIEFTTASNGTRTTANFFVENLKAGGGTNTLEGLREALATNEVEEIILMSGSRGYLHYLKNVT